MTYKKIDQQEQIYMESSDPTEVPSTEMNNNNAEMECIADPVSMLKILMDIERPAMQDEHRLRCVSESICHQRLHQNASQCQEDHKQETTKSEDVFASKIKRGRPPGSCKSDSARRRERNTIAEKRRREKLNESIRALRSAVPFITKMDKVSTFKDAITYVRDLQRQTSTLLNEIQDLQSSSSSSLFQDTKPLRTLFSNLRDVQVMKLDDHTFHVTFEVAKMPYVVAHIEKALASIIYSLNITAENFLVTQDGVIKNIWIKTEKLADANLEVKLKSIVVDAFATYNYDV